MLKKRSSFIMTKSFILDIVILILFKVVLGYSYISFVAPFYAYEGFSLDFNSAKYIEGWLVYFVLFTLLNRHKNHVVYFTLLLSFLLLIVPTIELYGLRNEPSRYFYSMVIPYVVLLFLISKTKLSLPYIKNGDKMAIVLSSLMVLIVLSHYVFVVGIQNINFDLSKVYDLRRSNEGIASNEGVFGYLNPWATKVFNIFLIAIVLWHRKYVLLMCLISVQLMLFGFSGHKSVVFSLIVLFSLFIFSKFKNPSTIIISSVTSLVVLILLLFIWLQNPLLPSILIRRVFFVPANLNYVYLEYFSSHDYIYWSNSILKFIFPYKHSVPPVYIIGEYLGKPDMSANTGFFGSGFMHLGFLGIIIYVFILSFFINLIQQFNKLPSWLINSIVFMPLLSAFVSSDLFTTLLTHGLLLSVFILFLYNSTEIRGGI
jgi:hypothetical protein